MLKEGFSGGVFEIIRMVCAMVSFGIADERGRFNALVMTPPYRQLPSGCAYRVCVVATWKRTCRAQ